MTTIFISGSREITFVPDEVKVRVDRIVDSGFDIIVGDSERGVDSAILRYLGSRSYTNVSVYTIHSSPRVKTILDDWRICRIESNVTVKTDKAGNVRNRRELETEKDRAMGSVADFGLVVWQSTYINRFGNTSVSKGSLRNMHQLLNASKPVVLYKTTSTTSDYTSFECFELRTLANLSELISSEPSIVGKAYSEIEKASLRSNLSLFDAMG